MLRYSEIRREMGNITDAVLAAILKGLIGNGIVERRSYDEIPPRVEYSLTEKGASVVPILQSICRWGGILQGRGGHAHDSVPEMRPLGLTRSWGRRRHRLPVGPPEKFFLQNRSGYGILALPIVSLR